MIQNLAERLRSSRPRRICVIKPSSLGDIVHALPILPALRKLFPDARISWVVNQGFRSLLDGHPDLDEVIAYDRGGSGVSGRSVVATARLCGMLLDRRFDLTIDLQGLLRSGLMTAATRAGVRLGMADAREGATWFYTDLVTSSRLDTHAVDRVLQVASALGDDGPVARFTIPVSEDDRRWAVGALAGLPRPRLALNMGARWLTKRWPPEHFAEIARRAAMELGAGLVAVGSAEDRPLARAIRDGLGNVPCLDLTGKTSLRRLAAVARECDLFVSNDTGPLHLAAAAGATVVGIYTCTDPRRTGPYGANATVVRSCVWCAPSFRKSCDRLECFRELTPARVWPAVRQQLEKSRHGTIRPELPRKTSGPHHALRQFCNFEMDSL
ncbi:Lipopolysaccharide heptosyltransferase 1 [Aquisphaera giovannonii]|uniref:Lipopolysaccharide heptosyltransferase 1 n=1 Tax=Aquisphaera giovannonii TaxID=406548 RepID=A0A5B9WAH3_9BACT|nr:glycosyltransferase family 9 protein [Aquisphaera giovannonii]QEH37648.1 Lipopolysaccharide heptosyltransferase 1 [Aquisphaera giovannonii]